MCRYTCNIQYHQLPAWQLCAHCMSPIVVWAHTIYGNVSMIFRENTVKADTQSSFKSALFKSTRNRPKFLFKITCAFYVSIPAPI